MQSADTPTLLRRSSRVPTAVQLLVTSLEGKHFSDVCETLVVNAHGCSILTRVKLDTGVPLHFHSKDGRETTAHVVSCDPTGPDHRSWRLGAELDRPENFWGLRPCPDDWTVTSPAASAKLPQILKATNTATHELSSNGDQSSEAALDRLARQLEAPMKRVIAESVRPLAAEIVSLKERVARREANPNRFEVSLSSIPPELEQQIESRLRKDLGPKVLEDARERSSQLMASAKATLDKRAGEAYENYHRMVVDELNVVQKRAQDISACISEKTQEHFRGAQEDFHRKLLEGGNSLKRLSEELLAFLQHNLNAEHEARRGDLEQLRKAVSSESGRLQDEIAHLDSRVGKLDEAARNLESGLDQRLSRMSSDTVKDTRKEFESAANEILEDVTARSVRMLHDQLQETSGNMKSVHEEIVASVSDSLKAQAASALQAFEGSMENLAKLAVERYRVRLEGALTSLTKSLNDQFRSENAAGEGTK